MIDKKRNLVIGSKFGGLGDHLFLTPIPRLYKIKYPDSKVFLSYQSKFRSWEIYKLLWQDNPFLDGIIDEEIDLRISTVTDYKENLNIIELLLKSLSIKIIGNDAVPEIYNIDLIKPIVKENDKYDLIDMNYISYIGSIRKKDIRFILKKNISKNSLIVNPEPWILKEFPSLRKIHTKSLYHYASLIKYSNNFFVLPSGGSHLALALNIKAKVYYGFRFNSIFLNQRNDNFEIQDTSFLKGITSSYLEQKNLMRYDDGNNYIKEPSKIRIFIRILSKLIYKIFQKIKL